jgi:citrate lyase subunit beta / citryl-CoA lyase
MRLRSVLFAPANRRELVLKMPNSGPDAVVLDLEDAVPAAAKAAARADARELVPVLRAAHPELAVFVRVNAPTTAWFAADIGELSHDVTGVVVPKVESPGQLDVVAGIVHNTGPPALFVGLETVAGVQRCEEILGAHDIRACYFGAEDFVADLGGVRTQEGLEVLYARSKVAIAARIAGVTAVDQIVTSFRAEDQFRADAAAGRSLGYRGKLCIHPAQVPLANAAFTPSGEAVARARRIIDAYEAATREGRASIDFEGQMIDEALVVQARALLDA